MGKSGKNTDRIGSGKRLTRARARLAAKALMAGKSGVDAMQAAGYTRSSAYGHPEKVTDNTTVKEELATLKAQIARSAEKYNLTADRLVRKAVAGLDAKESKSMAFQIVEVDDHDAQIKWWDRCAAMIGMKSEESDKSASINIEQLFLVVKQAREARGLPL